MIHEWHRNESMDLMRFKQQCEEQQQQLVSPLAGNVVAQRANCREAKQRAGKYGDSFKCGWFTSCLLPSLLFCALNGCQQKRVDISMQKQIAGHACAAANRQLGSARVSAAQTSLFASNKCWFQPLIVSSNGQICSKHYAAGFSTTCSAPSASLLSATRTI